MAQANQQLSKIGRVLIEGGRLAFTHTQFGGIFQPSKPQLDPATGKMSQPAYSCVVILTRDHKSIPNVMNAMRDAARAKWGASPVANPQNPMAPPIPAGDMVLQALIAGNRICMRDGNSKPDIEGYPGNLFISLRSPTPPKFFNHVPLEITLAEAQASGLFFSGALCNVSLAIWPQANQYGKRMNAQLLGLQFARDDGVRLGGGGAPASAEEFGAVEQTAQAANEFGALFGGAQSPPAQANDFNGLLGIAL